VDPKTGLVAKEWLAVLQLINGLLAQIDTVLTALSFSDINGTLTASQALAVPLDTFGAPTDVTTLNATAAHHGLLPKLDGNPASRLGGDGLWH
jgi:hypothetical protein